MSNPVAINAIIQFTGATSTVWASLTTPVPLGLVTLEMDTGVMKRGDGVTLYANLPTLINLDSLTALMTGAVTKTGNTTAQSADVSSTGGTTLFAINGTGNVVMLTPALLYTWLLDNNVVQVVNGNLQPGSGA